MKVYLDNAATTTLSRTVFQAMEPYLFEHFGNPSSAHQQGRAARSAIETSRATIASLLNTTPDTIIFTSGGTEADNLAIISAIRAHGIKLAITSNLEHHAVLNTLKQLEKAGEIQLLYLKHDARGNISVAQLERLLEANDKAFVSLMHGNNEIGNLNDIHQFAEVCKSYGAIFHSDTVQSIYQYQYDTQLLKADFLVGSAHKFHGPKGVGFLYARNPEIIRPLINGGAQERGLRSGTENVSGIVGLAEALNLAQSNLQHHQQHVSNLKEKMINDLISKIPGIKFNGNSGNKRLSLPSVLSVSIPTADNGQSPLSYLDQHQIYASGGSACSSKSVSHVLNAIGTDSSQHTIRFSFSTLTTAEEIEYAVDKLSGLFVKSALKEVHVMC
ncbi:cysteine desulfurase family protein [Pedobacter sp. MC2016-24]|uniref:cysteine desulfurase family protein n=1 Tax=Pedobacter sp. MC2016-24 TaxID=2780090 RepID=UPI0018818639|nr:cysteine desulfurase family protein [Pedobacter sp. MC2016-24]MBE9598058.1 cysteine desulfurase [Pedobacter sp. MC2016-24]